MSTADGLSGRAFPMSSGSGPDQRKDNLGVITMAGNLTLTDGHSNWLRLDPAGVRTVTLPSEALSNGLWYYIANNADAAEAITVQDDTPATVATLLQNQAAFFFCDGVTWYSMGVLKSDGPTATPALLQSATVTVSAAEILALFATPKELVAAPAAGQWLEFVSAEFFYRWNAAAYTGIAAGEDWVVKLTNAAGAEQSAHIETTGWLDLVADARRFVRAKSAVGAVGDSTPVLAAPLVLHQLVAEIITGDSPVDVRVWYRVHTGLV